MDGFLKWLPALALILVALLAAMTTRLAFGQVGIGPGVELLGYGQTAGYLPEWWAQTRNWRGSLADGRLTVCLDGPEGARWVTDLSQSAMTLWMVQGRITETARRDLTVAEWQRCFEGDLPVDPVLKTWVALGEPAYHTVWLTTAGEPRFAEMNTMQRNNLGTSVKGEALPPVPGLPGWCHGVGTATINDKTLVRMTRCE